MAAAQDRVRRAGECWRARADVAAVLADCATWAAGAPLAGCAALTGLLQLDRARAFADGVLTAMAEAWRADPLAQLPFRHSASGGIDALQLYRVDGVSLSLVAMQPSVPAPVRSITFTDCERYEIVLAGTGRAIAFYDEGGGPPREKVFLLSPGRSFSGDVRHSRAVVQLDAPLVLLRLAKEPEHPQPTREVDIATGSVLHRASASPADSRIELAAAVLGAMGRSDAAQPLAAYACGQAGEGARWQALRNALAIDTATGFAALCRIAGQTDDPVRPDAQALLHSLCTAYPQLAKLREGLCQAS